MTPTPATVHLHPTAPLAERVLLPGDPGRALLLAQSLLREPRMFNHNRGLWGYSGETLRDGSPLTIQATGMGGPSAAIVVSELIDLGARTLVRVGTCGAIVPELSLGEIVAVTEAIAADGTSRALGAAPRIPAAEALADRLGAETGLRRVVTATTDLFYETRTDVESAWAADGASVVEMETATVLTLGRGREVETGALLIVSDTLVGERRRIEPEALRAAEHRLGDLALDALAVAVGDGG